MIVEMFGVWGALWGMAIATILVGCIVYLLWEYSRIGR